MCEALSGSLIVWGLLWLLFNNQILVNVCYSMFKKKRWLSWNFCLEKPCFHFPFTRAWSTFTLRVSHTDPSLQSVSPSTTEFASLWPPKYRVREAWKPQNWLTCPLRMWGSCGCEEKRSFYARDPPSQPMCFHLGKDMYLFAKLTNYNVCGTANVIMSVFFHVPSPSLLAIFWPFLPSLPPLPCRTIVYELVTLEHPFATLPLHSLIWQVGQGATQPLTKLSKGRFKSITAQCWRENPTLRPTFNDILAFIEQNVSEPAWFY